MDWKALMERLQWRNVVRSWFVLAVFSLLAAIDIAHVWDLRVTSLGGYAGICISAFKYGLFVLGMELLLGKHVLKWIYLFVVPYFLVIGLIQNFLHYNFNMELGGDWMLLVRGTSSQEIATFWQTYGGVTTWLLMAVVVSVIVLIVWLLFKLPEWRRSRKSCVVGTVFLLPLILFYAFPGAHKSAFSQLGEDLCSITLLKDTFRYGGIMMDMAKITNDPDIHDKVTIKTSVDGKKPIVVFMIGESATRNNWEVYGYKRHTTPYLMAHKDECVFFADVVTAAPRTQDSLRYVFSEATLEERASMHCSFQQVCSRAGYREYLISSQGHLGRTDSFLAFLFGDCVERNYLTETLKLPQGARFYDIELSNALTQALVDKSDGRIFFLHMKGSHYAYADNYPGEFKKLDEEDLRKQVPTDSSKGYVTNLNEYDNSIAYTDYVVGKVIDALRGIDSPVCLIYFSDHGESPRAKSWRSVSELDVWEVPFFVWFSEKYRQCYPSTVEATRMAKNKRLQTDQLFYGLLDIVQVDGFSRNVTGKNFLKEGFKVRSQRIVNGSIYMKDAER